MPLTSIINQTLYSTCNARNGKGDCHCQNGFLWFKIICQWDQLEILIVERKCDEAHVRSVYSCESNRRF